MCVVWSTSPISVCNYYPRELIFFEASPIEILYSESQETLAQSKLLLGGSIICSKHELSAFGPGCMSLLLLDILYFVILSRQHLYLRTG